MRHVYSAARALYVDPLGQFHGLLHIVRDLCESILYVQGIGLKLVHLFVLLPLEFLTEGLNKRHEFPAKDFDLFGAHLDVRLDFIDYDAL